MIHLSKKVYLILLIGGVLMGSMIRVGAQNCYERLYDASGIKPTQDQLNALESAACNLKNSIPEHLRDSFKVIDFGFYLHNENMTGSYPEVFQKVVNQVQLANKHYLLVGKQTDKMGIYKKFWISLDLPDSMLCISDIQESILSDEIKWHITDQFINTPTPGNFINAEISGINYLTEKVNLHLTCCENNQYSTECDTCPDDENIKRLLLEKEFTMMDIDSFAINTSILAKRNKPQNSNFTTPDLIDDFSNITVWIDGESWNLNEDLYEEMLTYTNETKRGVVASNKDLCLTELYERIQTDYYQSFESSIIEFVWVHKNEAGIILEQKLFFKTYFQLPNYQETVDINEQNNLQLCHPNMGVPSTICTAYELPAPDNSTPHQSYLISSGIDDNGDNAYYGYLYNDEQLRWERGDIVEYNRPIDDTQQQDCDLCTNDCSSHGTVPTWSNFARLMNTNSTRTLIKDFERWTKNNILAGLEDDLNTIVRHYYYGNGSPLVWNCDQPFSMYIRKQKAIENFLLYFQGLCYNWVKDHANFEDFIQNNFTNIQTHLPNNIPAPDASPVLHATAAIAIGGIQGWKVSIVSLKKIPCYRDPYSGSPYFERCYEVEVHLTLMDIFGAGTDDRDRGGPWSSQISLSGDNRIPGLSQMWILQHCRNFDCGAVGGTPPCFVPFKHYVNFGHKFNLCYNEGP